MFLLVFLVIFAVTPIVIQVCEHREAERFFKTAGASPRPTEDETSDPS